MGERTSHAPGTFSWVDLVHDATRPARSASTAALFGWDFDDLPVGDGVVYTMCLLDGKAVCAISAQQEQERSQGIPPHWNNYVTVDDVDATHGEGGRARRQRDRWSPSTCSTPAACR